MTKPAPTINNCATCAFFVPGWGEQGSLTGECRRYPPDAQLGFARTSVALWCGEWSDSQ